jgi:starch-binding outer membrane protein, SusD/RagB family
MNKFTTDNRYGVDALSNPVQYFDGYITGINYQYPLAGNLR